MALEDIPIWSIPPTWGESVVETLEWLTPVLRSPLSVEQRFANRLSPRQSIELSFVVHGPTRTFFDLFVFRLGGLPLYFPLWYEVGKMTNAVFAGYTYVPVPTGYTEFVTAKAIFIQDEADPFNYEVVEVFGIDPNFIALATSLTKHWPTGTKVYPLRKCYLERQPETSRRADRAHSARCRFISLEPNTSIDIGTGFGEIDGELVLQTDPNEGREISYTYSRSNSEIDNRTGLQDKYDVVGAVTQQFSWFAKGIAAASGLRGIFYALRGRLQPFWFPTFYADLYLAEDITGNFLIVRRCGFTDVGGPTRNREYILIELRDGSRLYRKITDSAFVGDGSTERLLLNDGFGNAHTVASVKRISFLVYGRLDQDAVEIEHHTDTKGGCTVQAVFKDVNDDPPPLPAIGDLPGVLDCGQPSPNSIIRSNGGLTVQGGNAVGAELAQTCEVASGRFYFEVTMDSGASSDLCAIGIATNSATVADIDGPPRLNGNWNNGVGYNSQGDVDSDGITQSILNGNITPGSTLAVCVDTINHRIYFYVNHSFLDDANNPNSAPSLQPASGDFFGAYNFSGLATTDYLLTILFKVGTTDKFTLKNSGFSYIPPMGYGLGWGGDVPNAATYLGLDPVNSVNVTFGIANHGARGNGSGGSSGVRSLAGKSGGRYYVEFMKSQLVDNATWVGVCDSQQDLTTGMSAHAKGLVGAGGGLGNVHNNTIGQIVVDCDAKLMWIRGRQSDNWNNNALADPETGVGGADLSALVGAFYIGMGQNWQAAEDMVFISNPSYFKYSVPAGFTGGW